MQTFEIIRSDRNEDELRTESFDRDRSSGPECACQNHAADRSRPAGSDKQPSPKSETVMDAKSDATVMLDAIAQGDHQAAEQLLVLVYDELRRLAASKIAQEAPGQTLQPTALVHEAWLRLVGSEGRSFKDRTHFFRASAEAMRRILIDRARRKRTQRHGGGIQRVDLDFESIDLSAQPADDHMLALNDALEKLAVEHPVQADLVKLRYFAGLTNEEVSEVLVVSVSTVKNYWSFARAWLLKEMRA
jgi:RNA polymerase sigma factor (TIGR02999 family)